MRRKRIGALVAAACMLVATTLAIYHHAASSPPPLYTVREIMAGIAHAPQRWISREVRILGIDMAGGVIVSMSGLRTPGVPVAGLLDPRDRPSGVAYSYYSPAAMARSLPIAYGRPPDTRAMDPVHAFVVRALDMVWNRQVFDLRGAKIYTGRLTVQSPCMVENMQRPCVVADLGRMSNQIIQ